VLLLYLLYVPELHCTALNAKENRNKDAIRIKPVFAPLENAIFAPL
jgi:hypothetical protein